MSFQFFCLKSGQKIVPLSGTVICCDSTSHMQHTWAQNIFTLLLLFIVVARQRIGCAINGIVIVSVFRVLDNKWAILAARIDHTINSATTTAFMEIALREWNKRKIDYRFIDRDRRTQFIENNLHSDKTLARSKCFKLTLHRFQ